MSMQEADIVFMERRTEIRIAVSLAATVMLDERRRPGGKPYRVDCRAVNLSPTAIAVKSEVAVAIGEPATLWLDHFGEFRGQVMRRLAAGFVVKIERTAEENEALATKIHYFEQIKNYDVPERRRAKRVVPRNRKSQIVWPDGKVEPCSIVDLSPWGAAVAAKAVPDVGTVLALGHLVGRVVRPLKGGFAIQFADETRRAVARKAAARK